MTARTTIRRFLEAMPAALGVLALAAGLCSTSLAQRLLDEQPYDRVVLSASNGNAVVKVRPLPFPDRRVPNPFPGGRLEVRRVENLGQPYEVLWSDISRIELFEEMLLAEGLKLARQKEFDEAFDYFQRVHSRYPNTRGLDRATSQYLMQNARAAFNAGENDRALAILASLYQQRPDFPGLASQVDAVAERIIVGHLKARDFRSARSVLDVVSREFGPLKPSVITAWTARFQKGADDQVRRGAKLFREKKYRDSRSAALQAKAIWPDHKQAQQLLDLIQRDNPAVVVGVRTPAPPSLRPRIDSLAAMRTGFLAAPTLTRITDYSPEGGIYASPIGAVGLDATGRELTLSVLDYPADSPAALGAPASVARWLLQAANPDASRHRPELAAVVGSVLTPEPDLLVVGLGRSHVRPEALLQEVLLSECRLPAPLGAFTTSQVEPGIAELNAVHAAGGVSVVEERLFDSDADALAAITRGDIDVLDRVAPWQLKSLKSSRQVSVGQYRLPTVHVLIPTKAKKILDRREFRRALCYGIDRERVLREIIQGGDQLPGYRVVSGPFPTGVSLSDPVRYAYNDAVVPRPYEPRLAALLTALSWTNLTKAEVRAQRDAEREAAGVEESGEGESGEGEAEEPEIEIPPFPTLRLAHDADPVARAACEAIKLQLTPLGIPLELVELPVEKLVADEPDFDLRYAELATWEPLVDAKRLLGPNGVAGRCSDPMFSALERLDGARNWNEALDTLRDVHELAAGDLPVIPLWQTANYYAFRKELNGLPATTIHLYQSLGDWRKGYRTAGR